MIDESEEGQTMTEKPTAAKAAAAKPPTQAQSADLTMKAVLAAINDGADDPDTVEALNKALHRFGAQDPSMELPRSWARVQRRIGVDPQQLNGVATAEHVGQFAERVGLTITK